MYIYNALERQRVAVMSFQDLYGQLPGDSDQPVEIDGVRIAGNSNGKIETENGEYRKVFYDLYVAGVLPGDKVRVRSRPLQLFYVVLREGDKVLGEGHFFKLSGIHMLEAKAYDLKYDDGNSDKGNALYAKAENDTADLYVKLDLYQ